MSERPIETIKPGPKPGFKLSRTDKGYKVCYGTKTYEVTVENENMGLFAQIPEKFFRRVKF